MTDHQLAKDVEAALAPRAHYLVETYRGMVHACDLNVEKIIYSERGWQPEITEHRWRACLKCLAWTKKMTRRDERTKRKERTVR